MKLSQTLVLSILFLIFVSCRESLLNTKDSIPKENPQHPLKKGLDTIYRFKDEKKKTKKTKTLDSLKPLIAANLVLRFEMAQN
ncbi:MAG: hypothetical protein WBB27_11455 [Maribacter sp.]